MSCVESLGEATRQENERCWPMLTPCSRYVGTYYTRGPFPPAAAMVGYGCDGCWRRTSDQPTVGIVKIVYESIFLYSYVVPKHSWHLTWQLNKKDLDLHTLSFMCFLCPGKYGSRLSGGCAIIITTGKKKIQSSVWRVRDRYYDRKKKRYSRLSGGCAIIITTRKKKDTVVYLAGVRSLLRLEQINETVVCLAGAQS
jgi:hypothetical protein